MLVLYNNQLPNFNESFDNAEKSVIFRLSRAYIDMIPRCIAHLIFPAPMI